MESRKNKWAYTIHSSSFGETGDVEEYIRLSNGKDVLQSCGEELEEEQLQQFCDLLNCMPDLWSHNFDATEFENSQLKKQIERLQEENNRLKGLLKEAFEAGYDRHEYYFKQGEYKPGLSEWLDKQNIKL
jgi:hypothetical protein